MRLLSLADVAVIKKGPKKPKKDRLFGQAVIHEIDERVA